MEVDCTICNNLGLIFRVDDGQAFGKPCVCMVEYNNKIRIQKSGLARAFEVYTFDKYIVSRNWQKVVKGKALEFVENSESEWFFIGGAVGSGKSHICTAICAELIKHKNIYYMPWRDDVVNLKANVTDALEYQVLINKLKTIEVLYIDDFFKGSITLPDKNVAFEILNSRYNKRLTTIISSEHGIDEIIGMDEAIGSRIFQMSKNYSFIIPIGKFENENNYRLNN